MDHQPFEDWILDKSEIVKDEKDLLKQHILDCDQCHELKNAWDQVETLLVQTPMAAPVPGFSQRFAFRMQAKKAEIQRKQSIRTLIAVGIALFLITTLIVVLMIISYSTGELIVGAVSTFTGIVQRFINLRISIAQFFSTLPTYVIVLGWLILIVWGIILTPLWGFTVWKVSKQGVLQK